MMKACARLLSPARSDRRTWAGYFTYAPWTAVFPSGIQNSRNRPITWSSRTPTAWPDALRMASMKGAQWAEQDAGGTGLARPPRGPAKVGEAGDAPAGLPTE